MVQEQISTISESKSENLGEDGIKGIRKVKYKWIFVIGVERCLKSLLSSVMEITTSVKIVVKNGMNFYTPLVAILGTLFYLNGGSTIHHLS
jgi:hypothetical protein